MFKKLLFVSLGTLSMIFGIIGIFIPGLPTTPFLLLAAYLFLRSSERLYKFIISYRLTAKYLQRYRNKNGMSLSQKIYALTIMWIMIIINSVFFINNINFKIFIVIIGIIGSVVMGIFVKTVK